MAKPVYSTGDVPTADEFNQWLVGVNFAYKLVSESVTSSTVIQADDYLFLPVQANAIYTVKLVLSYSAAAAADLKLLFRVPTGSIFTGMGTTLVTGAASQQDIQAMPYGAGSEVWGGLGAGTQYGMVDGLLRVGGTAGDFAVDWAQNVSNATPTTLNAGSWLKLDRVS